MAFKVGTGFGQLYGAVTVYLHDTAGNITECSSATGDIPSAVAGYAVGCKLMNTTNGILYTNTGSATSCTFTAVNTDTAGNIALTQGNIIVGNASNVGTALDAKTSGQILVGNGTTITSVAVGTDATLSSSGALTIAAKAVTGAKLATGTIYGAVTKACNGATGVDVFGTTNGFAGTITGIYVTTAGTVSGTITVKGTNGATIATVANGSTLGGMAGAQSLANTSITSAGTCQVVSSLANDTSYVLITFTVA